MDRLFSIIVVSLNPGKRLGETLNSISDQTFKDYEVIIKDGGSTDGSLDVLSSFDDMEIRLTQGPDGGIYDAMNKAVEDASGRYVYFLNCGDTLAAPDVLERTAAAAEAYDGNIKGAPAIFYGNIHEMVTGSDVMSNPKIDAFACYRNVPCHQACFYDVRLVREHPFDTSYKVRADYEQFLWCFFRAKAYMQHLGITVANYEGNGYSDSRVGRKISKEEHEDIITEYMTAGQITKYRFVMLITLSKLRTAVSKSRLFAGPYNAVKKMIYNKDRRKDT